MGTIEPVYLRFRGWYSYSDCVPKTDLVTSTVMGLYFDTTSKIFLQGR